MKDALAILLWARRIGKPLGQMASRPKSQKSTSPHSPSVLTTSSSLSEYHEKPPPRNGMMRSSRSFTKRTTELIATTTEGFRLLSTQAKCSSKSSRPALATTARPRDSPRRNSAASAPYHQRVVCCSSCAGCKSSNDRGRSPCICSSSICRKRTTL